jgi:hypothetical protein
LRPCVGAPRMCSCSPFSLSRHRHAKSQVVMPVRPLHLSPSRQLPSCPVRPPLSLLPKASMCPLADVLSTRSFSVLLVATNRHPMFVATRSPSSWCPSTSTAPPGTPSPLLHNAVAATVLSNYRGLFTHSSHHISHHILYPLTASTIGTSRFVLTSDP